MSKGSNRRVRQVTEKVYSDNWDDTFGCKPRFTYRGAYKLGIEDALAFRKPTSDGIIYMAGYEAGVCARPEEGK